MKSEPSFWNKEIKSGKQMEGLALGKFFQSSNFVEIRSVYILKKVNFSKTDILKIAHYKLISSPQILTKMALLVSPRIP